MAAAVFDQHGMIRHRAIKICDRERTIIRSLGVVVFESQHPFAGRGLSGAFSQRGEDVGNRSQIAVHHAQMIETRHSRMGMGIDEAGKNSIAAKIDLFCPAGRETEHFVIRADGEKSSARDRHSLCPGLACIDSPDVAVVKNEIGFGAQQRKKRHRAQRSESLYKLTA